MAALTPEQILGIVIPGVFGLIFGTVPFVYGLIKKQLFIGISALILCIAIPFFLPGGILFSILLAAIECYMVYRTAKRKNEAAEAKRLRAYNIKKNRELAEYEKAGITVPPDAGVRDVWPPIPGSRNEE